MGKCQKAFNVQVDNLRSTLACYIFFPRVILYNFFLFLLIYGGLGFGVLWLGSYFGFLGLGLSVDRVWGLWCGAFWVFLGLGSLYKHKRITLGKK